MTLKEKPDYITENPDHSVEVTLSRSYEFSGTQTEKITLREPTAGDMKTFSADGEVTGRRAAELETKMLADLTGCLAPADLDALALRDYRRVQEAFGFFTD